jgi:hypothetical protein
VATVCPSRAELYLAVASVSEDSNAGGPKIMSWKTNSRLLLASFGIVAASSACAGDIAGGDNTEERSVTAEQKYTPKGRLIHLEQKAVIGRLNNWGQGDTDVYTQKGRIYSVYAWADTARHVEGSGAITTTVYYYVYENYPDYTTLYNSLPVSIPIADQSFHVNQIVNAGTSLDLSEKCPYNNCQYQHTWTNPTLMPAPGSEEMDPTIQKVTYWYDGMGPDDNGNANATFDLRVWVDVTDY